MAHEQSGGMSLLRVRRRPGRRHEGILIVGGRTIPVALGRAGIRHDKREGDGATPAGCWRILAVRYRPDAGPRPATALPCNPLRRDDGWCDAAGHRRYNRPVKLPFPASHERMWRPDPLYDLVLILSHNTRPRISGRGSAVFLHLARPGFLPTEGCVALRRRDLERLLTRLRRDTEIVIGP